jgi:chemotaxis response regulator CheB
MSAGHRSAKSDSPTVRPSGASAEQPRSPKTIVLAASAGGLRALIAILECLPRDFPAAVLIVQHRASRPERALDRVLTRHSALPVAEALEGEVLQIGRVYLAPPDFHLVIRPDFTLAFTDGSLIHHLRSSANPLLASASAALGDKLIAVVLTGSGRDASDGVQAVKAAGGTVIAQTPETSEYAGMPRAAIESGAVDMILPLVEIGPALVRMVRRSKDDPPPEGVTLSV